MTDGIFYLFSGFWLGALHAATPGHGKTIAASYIVGARGRPVDAFVLGIFVTLSHTSGIILVALLATLGSAWVVPHRMEAYLAVGTGVLVIGIGLWMLRTQFRVAPPAAGDQAHAQRHADGGLEHTLDPRAVHGGRFQRRLRVGAGARGRRRRARRADRARLAERPLGRVAPGGRGAADRPRRPASDRKRVADRRLPPLTPRRGCVRVPAEPSPGPRVGRSPAFRSFASPPASRGGRLRSEHGLGAELPERRGAPGRRRGAAGHA